MGNNRYKILLIEDDANIRSLVSTVLESGGYQSIAAQSCSQGKLVFSSHCPDLVILDLGLPDGDGLELIPYIQRQGGVPIIVLSARSQESDKVAALDLGASDYVTKPFGTAELLARVRAALRSQRTAAGSSSFTLDGLHIDYDKRTVSIDSRPVSLTQTEYNILSYLSEHAGKVLTYTAIIKAVWGYSDPGSVKRLQVNMANIRKKLGVQPGENRYVINDLGVGYRMPDGQE